MIFAGAASAFAQSITGFGTGDFTRDGSSTGTFSQDANGITVTLADLGGQLVGSFAAPASIVGNTSLLSLTATVTTNPGTSFTLELIDNAALSQSYNGSWGSFTTGSSSTATLTFGSATPGFNFANILGMTLSTAGGNPSNSVMVTLDQLTAVPEPSTYAAIFGLACLGAAIVRQKRRAAVAA